MKIRSDFVTNSSSSSFIVFYKDAPSMLSDLQSFVKNYQDDEYSHQFRDVVTDILRNKITYEQAINKYQEYLKYLSWRDCQNNEEKIKEFGGCQNWINSNEFALMREEYEKKELEKFKEKISDTGIFAYLTYSDSDGYYDVTKSLQDMLNTLCINMGEY